MALSFTLLRTVTAMQPALWNLNDMRDFIFPKHRCQICKQPVYVTALGKATGHTFNGSETCAGKGLKGVPFGNRLKPVAGAFEFEAPPQEAA